MEQKELRLSLKEKWFRMIESGDKAEEYREITPYWCNRLLYSCSLGVEEYWSPILEKTFQTVEKLGGKYPNTYSLNNLLVRQYGTRGYTHVHFTLGYPSNDDKSRHMVREIREIVITTGNPRWGAEEGKKYFVIRLKS